MFEKLETRIAQAVSYALHPLLIPSYGLGILFILKPFFVTIIPGSAWWMIFLMLSVLTVILPLFMMGVLRFMGILPNLSLSLKHERTYPLILVAACYLVAFMILKKLDISDIFILYYLGATICALGLFAINQFWKISLHMTALGALTAVFTGLSASGIMDMPMWIATLIFAAGMLGFARLKLGQNNLGQVASGYFFGFITFLFIYQFYL